MSDYNLEDGSNSRPRRATTVGGIPTLSGGVTPQAYDLPLVNAYPSSGERMAAELSQALGQTGQVIGQLGALAERTRVEDERIARMNAEERKHYTELLKASATTAVNTDLPSVQSDFANGRIPVPTDDPAPLVESLLAQKTQGMESVKADEYRRLARPKYTEYAVALRDKNKQDAESESLSMFGDRAAHAATSEELSRLVSSAHEMFPSATPDQLAVAIPLRALSNAAHAGDAVRFAAAKEALGDRFSDKQTIAEVLLNDSVRRRQTAVDSSFEDAVASKYGQPAAIVRETINAWQGKASPDRIRAELRTVDAEERSANAKAYGEAKILDLDTKKADLVTGALELMRSAATTGGASQIPDRVQVFDLDGKSHDVSRSDIVGPAISAEMFRLSKLPPAQVLPEQVRFLANNGETFDGWKRVMEAGPVVNSIDIDKATAKDIPSNLSKGYALYKSIGAINPRLRDRHVSDASSNRFYELSELAEKYATPGDPNAALLMAVRAARREPFGDNAALHVRSQLIGDEINRRSDTGWLWWNQKVRNANEVGAETARIADLYVHALGISPAAAVDEAAKRIDSNWTVINDWMVPTRGRNVPIVLPAAAKVIAEGYAKSHGKAEGLEAADLVLQPADVPGLWILWNRSTLSPVQHWASEGRFTDSDFAKLVGNLQSGKEDSAADRLSHGMNLPGAFKNSHDTFNEAVRAGIAGDPLLANFLDAPPPKK